MSVGRWTTLLAVALLALVARAQDPAEPRRLEVRVTAISGASFYVDRGSDDGLAPGDRVRLFPVGRAEVGAVVRTVTRRSARCELDAGPSANTGTNTGASTGVDVGVRGEVLVDDPSGGSGETPAHPPWSYPAESWSLDQPLLAPPRALTAAEREPAFSGRWYTQLDWTGDREGLGDREYSLARTGVDFLWENPFGRGGGLNLDAELYRRASSFDSGFGGASDEEDTRFRLDRLSYYRGGTREEPWRWEGGRFLQRAFPEFGVLDGFEVARRLDSGDRVGGSLGFLPEPFPEMETGDDLQVAAFYEKTAGENDELAVALGVQKTWHEGEADRDLAILRADWAANERLSLYGSAWVDLYGSGDEVKDGAELTELHLAASYRGEDGYGLGAGLSHIAWPELMRNEFAALPPGELADAEVTRYWVSGWTDLGRHLRLSARADHWTDEDDSGSGGSLRLGWRDVVIEDGELGLEVFSNDGIFSSVLGARATADGPLGAGRWNAALEFAEYTQDEFNGGQEHLLQQDARIGYDRSFRSGWTLSLFGEQRFGDEQDSTSLGLFLQRRF